MNNKNKHKLYESIMSLVTKNLKKTLNESQLTDSVKQAKMDDAFETMSKQQIIDCIYNYLSDLELENFYTGLVDDEYIFEDEEDEEEYEEDGELQDEYDEENDDYVDVYPNYLSESYQRHKNRYRNRQARLSLPSRR